VQFGAVRSLTLLGLEFEGLTVLGMSASQASCRGLSKGRGRAAFACSGGRTREVDLWAWNLG
jgi:hypothetical protein